ncbi:MAG: class I SAM-dependent methyltransferase, partial [Acidimicrobiia bacterium]|nr:class I SAM-dependent methyltransferase [Acidimicrobiia bacterium]
MDAVDHWRSQLEAWALPQDLLDAVPWNPYEWPAELFSRRDTSVANQDLAERHTNAVIRRFEPVSLIDIGAGTGGSCLQYAEEGVAVTAVEPDGAMAAKLRSLIAERGVTVDVIEGSWPDAAGLVLPADVVTCSHVIHNVPNPGPFLWAMQSVARRAVVIQEFEVHPWAHLGPYYRQLHGLDRPVGPTVDDLVAVIEELLGLVPAV